MPPIKSTLAKYDLDLLHRIARAWDVEISQRDAATARTDLAARMADKGLFQILIAGLPEEVRIAWQNLAGKDGRQTWSEFSRQNGMIRDLGPAARERENPDRNPVSISESLFYSGLIGRAFLGGTGEPVEYAYIPEELLGFIEKPPARKTRSVIRPAVNQTPRFIQRTDNSILDQLTDLLSANRMRQPLLETVFTAWGKPKKFMESLLVSSGMVAPDGQPVAEALKTFFNADRDTGLHQLYKAWLESREINELRILPGLVCEGNWQNDPIAPRKLLVELINELADGTWWSISSLLAAVKDANPDFQRPAGDYDSWFIREEKSGGYLTGFSSWERVEGALLYYLLTGPLHWLGLVNLARGSNDGRFTAFQLVPETRGMLRGDPPVTGQKENKPLQVKNVRLVLVPVGAPRMLRYQVGRFCQLSSASLKESRYLLTIASLNRASEQGLHLQQLLQLLDKEQPGIVPFELRRLAERWSRNGVEVRNEQISILRFRDKAGCAEFVKNAEGKFNFEVLNPFIVAIAPSQQEGIIRLLAELGILVETEADV